MALIPGTEELDAVAPRQATLVSWSTVGAMLVAPDRKRIAIDRGVADGLLRLGLPPMRVGRREERRPTGPPPTVANEHGVFGLLGCFLRAPLGVLPAPHVSVGMRHVPSAPTP